MNKKWFLEASLALRAVAAGAHLVEKKRAENLVSGVKGSPRDVVTKLDEEIEDQAVKILKASSYPIIGEEMVWKKNLRIDASKPTWLVDPIDGTTNLISGVPFYAVSVGLLADLHFVVGAVAVAPQKEMFFTMGNQGSFLNSRVLKRAQPTRLNQSLIAASFSGNNPDQRQRKQEYELFGIINDKSRGCLRLGSAATNICFVAAGRLQAAYGIDNKIWDVAGALAIVLQAGGRLYLGWHQGSLKLNYVVGAPGVADELAQLLSSKKMIKLENYEAKSL